VLIVGALAGRPEPDVLWLVCGPHPDRSQIQVLRFGCSYASIADCACSATTIRDRRDEWIRAEI
jgi:hypothetical protein